MIESSKVTIGITCFNSINYISDCLHSAIKQNYTNKEIIVVDDFSMDGSYEEILKIKRDFPEIKVIRNDRNLGCPSSRNKIIKSATGKYICFFDDDDISFFNRVSEQVILYEKTYTELGGLYPLMCYCSAERVYPNGYKMRIRAIGDSRPVPGSAVIDYLLSGKSKGNYNFSGGTPTFSLFTSLDLLKKIGGFDRLLIRQEDVDLAIKAGMYGVFFIGTKKILIKQNATIGSHKTPFKELKSTLRILEKYNYLIQGKKLSFLKKWNLLKFFYFKKARRRMIFFVIHIIQKYPSLFFEKVFKYGMKRIIHDIKNGSIG